MPTSDGGYGGLVRRPGCNPGGRHNTEEGQALIVRSRCQVVDAIIIEVDNA